MFVSCDDWSHTMLTKCWRSNEVLTIFQAVVPGVCMFTNSHASISRSSLPADQISMANTKQFKISSSYWVASMQLWPMYMLRQEDHGKVSVNPWNYVSQSKMWLWVYRINEARPARVYYSCHSLMKAAVLLWVYAVGVSYWFVFWKEALLHLITWMGPPCIFTPGPQLMQIKPDMFLLLSLVVYADFVCMRCADVPIYKEINWRLYRLCVCVCVCECLSAQHYK